MWHLVFALTAVIVLEESLLYLQIRSETPQQKADDGEAGLYPNTDPETERQRRIARIACLREGCC